jgi:hypothetical protein
MYSYEDRLEQVLAVAQVPGRVPDVAQVLQFARLVAGAGLAR